MLRHYPIRPLGTFPFTEGEGTAGAAVMSVYMAILFMGLVTYGSRLSGYYLFGNMTPTGRMKAALDAVPASVLTAVIAPNVFLNGPAEMVGGAVALAAALLRAPLLVTIGVGMAAVAFLRLFI